MHAIIAEAGRLPVFVEPRPLQADTGVWEVSSERLVPLSAQELARRVGALHRAGVDTIDATKTGQNATCKGVLVKPSPGATDAHRRGCPKEPFYVAAIALPRSGSPRVSPQSLYDRELMAAPSGYVTVRVIVTNLSELGSSVHIRDYVLQETPGGWTVRKRVGLMYVE